LAGIFAAKEAVTKALSMRPGHWLNIAIEQAPTGAPRVVLAQSPPTLEDIGISISHDGDYALAFAVALLR
jgi:phosphopantetheinyl transferase (holo-ACP synthase)